MSAKNDNSVGKKIAAGALIAGVAGYVAGILSAPQSGKETRQDIKDTASKAKSDTEKKIKELQAEVDSLVADAKTKGKKLSAKAQAELNEAIEKAQTSKNKSVQALAALKKGEASDPELDAAVKQLRVAKDHLSNFFKGE